MLRTTEAFIGQCPTIKANIEGVELQGLLDTGSQVTLMQQSLFEDNFSQAKLGKAPVVFRLRAANGLPIPYTSYAVLDFRLEGIKIPGRGVVVVKDEHCTHPLIVGMNVVTACWNTLFKLPGKPVFPPRQGMDRNAWREAFAVCQRIDAFGEEDGSLGYVWAAGGQRIRLPPRSEMVVWGRARKGPCGTDYNALVEALPDDKGFGLARSLVVVRGGRIPVRLCNPHPYSLFIGRHQKLGRLHHVDAADVRGTCDLSLSVDDDGTVEVGMVGVEDGGAVRPLPQEMCELAQRPDLSTQQQEELGELLRRWEKVFAVHDEDFGQTDLVKHQIHTGDAVPIRE